MIVYVFFASFFMFLYFLVTRKNNYWKSKGVPYEKPFLFFGNFFTLVTGKEHFADTVRAIYNNHSDPYIGIYVLTTPYLMLRSLELIKKVLVKDADKFINRNAAADERADPISYHSLGFAKDSTWKNIRSKMSPVFTSGKMKLMFPLINECGKELRDYLERNNEKTVNMRPMTKRYTVDVISSCAFGINAYCLKDEDSVIMKTATQLFDFSSLKRNFSAFCFFFLPSLVSVFRLTFLDQKASDFLVNMFRTTLEERKEKMIVRNDLVDLLHNLNKNENPNDSYKFDDIKMAAQAISFFSAGNDTTSTIMSFALYELALHKDIQDRLREEIKESYEEHGDFTYESIQQLKYLDMVFNEVLRKYPLTSFLDRVAIDKYTFEEIGLTIDKGTAVMVPTSALQFDPKYFPEPEKFDPERFSDENKKNIIPYTFLPFGEGPRICIGQRFAQMSGKIGLAYAVKDFAFEPVKSTKIPLQFEQSSVFLMSKDGVPLKVQKV